MISILCTDQSVKLKLEEEETRVRRLKEELDKAAVCCRFYSTLSANNLPKKILKGLETSE